MNGEEVGDRRRLGHDPAYTGSLRDGELCGPIAAKADAVHDDALGIYLFPARKIVQGAAKNAIGRRTRLDGRLPGPRTVQREKANSSIDQCSIGFRQVFLATVETADRENERYRAICDRREPKITYDFLSFEGNSDHFERRRNRLIGSQENIQRFLIGCFLSFRYR